MAERDERDIVERLRANAARSPGYFGILGQAADEIIRLRAQIDEADRILCAPVDPPERVSAPLVYTCFECHAEGVESDDGYCEVNEGLAAVCSRECWEAFAARYDEPVERVSEASALREALIALNDNVGDLANSAVQAKVRRVLEDTKEEG